MKLVIILITLLTTFTALAKVPTPPEGKRWVLNAQFSDEFNGNTLDKTKWNDTFGGWRGRKPAWFNPEAITVENGCLEIQSGVLDNPFDGYTMYGGAVTSKTSNAHYGYYEVSSKASRIAMSTTFWLSCGKADLPDTRDCSTDKYSQELDIQEGVGGVTGTGWMKDFNKSMHSNTHFRIVKCGESKETFLSEGANTALGSMIYEKFHTYGCWWHDGKKASFYANDRFFQTVNFRTDYSDTPFPRPMKINMVTETYDWQTPPSDRDLNDTSINTAYYDWVRSYTLVDVDEAFNFNGEMPFEESLAFVGRPEYSEESHSIKFKLKCKAKVNRKIRISLINGSTYNLEADTVVYAGYGIGDNEFHLVVNERFLCWYTNNSPRRHCSKISKVIILNSSCLFRYQKIALCGPTLQIVIFPPCHWNT